MHLAMHPAMHVNFEENVFKHLFLKRIVLPSRRAEAFEHIHPLLPSVAVSTYLPQAIFLCFFR